VHLRLHYLDELRRDYFTRVSVHIGFVTGIKQRPLPQLITGHVKWLFLWAHMELLRTMCGSRTGGWSLPCVMSD
jgi:hypothetical protein